MFLRQLTLKGFKSFAETTALVLEPGVTVVVGPNGSGKSNVVDAIAWVLGAQAPSSVRSQKMDDVIFAGTTKRPALGRAEVSLTIDNSAGLLPIDLSEVTITRTLWRSGDSEYAINGVPCRLLDVQELLSDSGVGRQQHVIVGQGQIDSVLNARPEDRRGIIEEAAGVLKYRKRKERAERRLEATEGNLLRVQDLLREVRRQLRPLERQADAARRHGAVAEELAALRVHLAGRELAALRRRLEALAVERRALAGEQTDIRRELARLDTEVLAAEAQLGASGASDLGDLLVRVEQLRERAKGLAAVLVERRRGLERERVQLMDASVAASLEAEAVALRSELAEVDAARGALEPELAALADEESAFGARPATDADEGAKATFPLQAMHAAAEVRGEMRTRQAARQRDEREGRALDTAIADGEARERELAAELDGLRAALTEGEAAEAPLVDDLGAAEARRMDAEGALEAAATSHQDVAARHVAARAQADALAMALDSARARAGAEHVAEVAGVLGALSDAVEVDDGWDAAFDAAAGEALTAVVVTDAGAARRALEHLQRAQLTGGVVAPGPVVPARLAPIAPSAGAGGEPVRAHVRATDPRVGGLLDVLLAGAFAVRGGWREALDVAMEHPDAVVVTMAGDRFSRVTWRLGGSGQGVTAAALEDARRRAEALEGEAARLDEAARRAAAELDAARLAEIEATRSLDAHDAEVGATSVALARRQHEIRELAQRLANDRLARQAAAGRQELETVRITELETALGRLEADEAREADAAHRRRELAVRAAGLDERRALVGRRLDEVQARLEARDAESGGDGASARVARIERSAIAVDRLARLVAAHRDVVEVRLGELHEERRRQTDEARAASLRLEQLRRERADAEHVLAELAERVRRVEIDDAEGRMRVEAAVEALRRELDTEPEVAMATAEPLLADGITAPARVRDLEREIRLMGPINPLALEEFDALQERHRFLEEQLDDVRSTRRELQHVIRSVDNEIQSVFATAFDDVSENFSALFATLFPGGSGRLVLTTPEDLLTTGIEVEAKPSGKNVKKLSLLSGGERSLTALAFLFAVFRSRPSPFYVMDEVEAALDDVNLHRFMGLIDEFRQEAQLVVVSHQKRTMEAADCLVGVTMQPGGSSRVLMEQVTAVTH